VSGPIQRADERCEDEVLHGIEAREGRLANVGGLDVSRVLPTKGRRTVGGWCFVDLMGPADAHEQDPMEVGPHPHIGLSTVTWLLEGEALHSDSLGTEQLIRPGQLNLMTAGHGIAHAELAAEPPFRGVQLWVAQPEETRHGDSDFQHYAELPRFEHERARGLLMAGSPPAPPAPTPPAPPRGGADVTLEAGRSVLQTTSTFEHAVVPLDGRVKVGPEVLQPGWIGLIPDGISELPVEAEHDDVRFLLLGGEPLGERVAMWWNFVARDRDELTAAYLDWRDRTDRFGETPSTLERIEAPRPPWLGAD
jgi:redox-sensitive bicupin YhaK (pirin superfamily)